MTDDETGACRDLTVAPTGYGYFPVCLWRALNFLGGGGGVTPICICFIQIKDNLTLSGRAVTIGDCACAQGSIHTCDLLRDNDCDYHSVHEWVVHPF